MRGPVRRILPAILLCTIATGPLPARASDTEFQGWTVLTAQGHVAERVRVYAELQPRVGLSPDAFLDKLLVRAALGWDITPSVTAWLGYAWTPGFHPAFKDEQRPFEQLTINSRVAGGSLQNRTRLEERFIEGANLSLRLRHLVRYAHPLGDDSPWLGVVSDELFVNANAPTIGPAQGIDQNRAFIGIDRAVGKVMLEFGYMLDTVVRPEKPVLQRSNVILGVALNLP